MLWGLFKPTKKFMKMKKWSSQWTQFMQLHKEAWKKIQDFTMTSTGLKLNPWPRDTGVMLYQLSYEATDVGSRSIVGSYVPVKEMSVNDIWNKSYMNCRNEMKMKKWSSQWIQCKQLCKEAWEKFRTFIFQASLRNCINCDDHFFLFISFP